MHAADDKPSEWIWFLDTVVMIHVPASQSEQRMSVIEGLARHGDSPPLHVHEREDEAFYVLDGELRLHVDGVDARVAAGQGALAPRGLPHTYRVESDTARWLAITTGEDFEQLVRSLGRPAHAPELPEPSGPPTPEQIDALTAAAQQNHIALVGPPLT